MGCISSKAFKGEGRRLVTERPAAPAGPPRIVGQKIPPKTISAQQAPKPTNKTSGSGPDDSMRSAAARAAAQRADSVSQAICAVPDQPTNVGPHETFVPRSSHSRALIASTKRDEH